MIKNWERPVILALDNKQIVSGGSGSSFPEFITFCNNGVISQYDVYYQIQPYGSQISIYGYSVTTTVAAGACS